jgi:hypothetical protein
LHDDGTLTSQDCERLADSLDEPEIVSRAIADERIGPTLAGHPRLESYRRESALALKLLDLPLWCPDDLLYCDSDVLFFRPFCGLFSRPRGVALFMADIQNAYSVRSWHLLRYPRLRLPIRVNTGIIAFPAESLDLDLLDWYFAHPQFRFSPVWVEQTCWALLAGRIKTRLVDPRQLVLPRRGKLPDPACIGAHFVGAVRRELPIWMPLMSSLEEAPAVAVRSLRARRCTALDLAITEGRRLFARL